MSGKSYSYRAPMFTADRVQNILYAIRTSFWSASKGSEVDVTRMGREFIITGERATDALDALEKIVPGGTRILIAESAQ